MRHQLGTGVLAAALLLQGCAQAPSHAAPVRLFAEDGSARFDVYVACTSRTVHCEDVQQSLQAWASSRHTELHVAKRNDAAFQAGHASPPQEQARPYRLAITYRPDIADSSAATGGGSMGNAYQPLVSYWAWIEVFDARTGERVKSIVRLHDEVVLRRGWGGLDGYVQAQLHAVIGHIDPSYELATAEAH